MWTGKTREYRKVMLEGIFGNILKFTPKMWSEETCQPLTSTFPTGYLRLNDLWDDLGQRLDF